MIVDKRIHRAYKTWDGRPMNIEEIATRANVNQNTIKRTLQSAMQKLRANAPARIREYLE